MDLQALFQRIMDTVDESAYFTPSSHVDPAQRAAMAVIEEKLQQPDLEPSQVRRLIERMHDEGHIDPVMRLSALHVLACHPKVADYAEAARLVGEQEFAALELGGPRLDANLASVDRHRGVMAFVRGHHDVALEYFARALERQRTAENVQNVLCTLCALNEEDEARQLLAHVRQHFPGALIEELEAAVQRDPDLALLREDEHDRH